MFSLNSISIVAKTSDDQVYFLYKKTIKPDGHANCVTVGKRGVTQRKVRVVVHRHQPGSLDLQNQR